MLSASLIAGASWDAGAHAQTLDDLTLRWQAPDACPDENVVLARIRAHLPEQHRSARHWSVQARVTSEGARYRLELELRSGKSHAHRTIANESCAALADAAALLVALALDPEATAPADPEPPIAEREPSAAGEVDAEARTDDRSGGARSAESARSPQPSRAGTAQEDRAPSPRRSTEASESRAESDASGGQIELGWDIGAALRLGFGMLPQAPALGLQPQLGLRFGRLSGRLGFTFWLEARTSSESYPNARLDGSGWLGDAGVCFELARPPITLAPCAVGEFGQLVLEPHDISSPARSPAGWGAVGAGVRTGYLIAGGVWATLDAHGLAPLSRPRWLVRTAQGDAELFTTEPVTARVAIGLSYAFE